MMFQLDEARTLRGFRKLLKGFNVSRDLVVVHNVIDFKLPFLSTNGASFIKSARRLISPSPATVRSLSSTRGTSGTIGRHGSSFRSTGWRKSVGLKSPKFSGTDNDKKSLGFTRRLGAASTVFTESFTPAPRVRP
jgi:hypothetical protein